MKILCICPTYGRPQLVRNALACFLAQDHPDKFLVIVDDARQISSGGGDNWAVLSLSRRADNLPQKYAAGVLAFPEFDAVSIWDDDDIYLPWHLSAANAALEAGAAVAKPFTVLSLYTVGLVPESGRGRFWASAVVSRDTLMRSGGFIITPRADFDQMHLSAWGPPTDIDCGFVFRWASTGHPHAQGFIHSPADSGWYHGFPQHDKTPVPVLTPLMDVETVQVIRTVSSGTGRVSAV